MREQQNIMPYYDEKGVFHTVDQIKREREEAARRNQNNQNPRNTQNLFPLQI